MNLFDRFHAAFDVAPPAGGFDRLRRELSRSPVDRSGRPGFPMRWNKMTLRLTAAAAAVVIAIALVAAYLAAQRPTTSYVSGASDTAYRSVNDADHTALIGTYVYTDCLDVTSATCGPRMATIKSAAQKWLADLQATPAPPRFAVIDRQMRLHLAAMISELNAVTAAIAAGKLNASNGGGFDPGTTHEALWLDRIANAIVYSKTTTPTLYREVVNAQKLSLESCALCQEIGDSAFSDCADPATGICWHEVGTVFDQMAVVLGATVQSGAPTELGSQDSRLQSDLATADTALLNMETAIFIGSPTGVSGLPSDRATYKRALLAIEADIAAILQS
ncbi:MAG TPA: hypothetical protein VGV88_03005 [Candidatus Dormibacteraeota bacterium]|nr:hypothetical protein [Candidatus Dormibacteraeota bacterium]